MDDRFPKWLRVVARKLDFFAIPNLGMLVAGLAVLGFFGQTFMGAPFERFVFDPERVLAGEWWRLFAFPTGLSNPIWLLFYVLYVYFVMNALEAQWGAGPLTLFTFLSYLAALGGAFLANQPLSIWYYVMENVSLAFGTLFPDMEFLLFFIVPVKAKWLAMLAGAMLIAQFVLGSLLTKAFVLIVMFPYLLFFSPMAVDRVKYWWRRRQNRKRFDHDMWR